MKKTIVGLVLATVLSLPAMAQGVSEAKGSVVDRDGKPIEGAVISIRAKSNPEAVYTGKTNKKGRFFISGMFTAVEDEEWIIECEVEGYTAVEVRVESRTVNKVLIADPWTAKIKPGSSPPEIGIRPLGTAKLDWKVARTEDLEAELRARQAGAGGGGAPAPRGRRRRAR